MERISALFIAVLMLALAGCSTSPRIVVPEFAGLEQQFIGIVESVFPDAVPGHLWISTDRDVAFIVMATPEQGQEMMRKAGYIHRNSSSVTAPRFCTIEHDSSGKMTKSDCFITVPSPKKTKGKKW